ncbi:hypothetical protein CAPTEDRAFT_212607 [Capitella teleta]|uniref:Carboxylesterase type B domain-containing protein n=1 Tax=Capitella teleta TaxID=283909 RepID=R7UA23_CAPTE|nr:hypothetical protein CAPTEDRAFT_212607 [Capitella teleta]|eukprot:ELT99985.1 hypothetical protein CAPTEDRAFT_212607 [Capitella teleta]
MAGRQLTTCIAGRQLTTCMAGRQLTTGGTARLSRYRAPPEERGYSVSLHIASPMSKGLFKRAIAQSGAFLQTVLAPPFYNNTAATIEFAECLGCPSESHAMAECLRNFPAERFAVSRSNPCSRILMQPALDGSFFPDNIEKLVKTKQYNRDIDIILGTVQNEGYFLTSGKAPHLVSPDTSLQKVEEFIYGVLSKRYPHLPQKARRAHVQEAMETYVRDPKPNGLIEAATQFMGDSLILWPTYAFALGLADTMKGNTFFYELRHRPSISRRPYFIGPDHCDDLPMMLGSQFTGKLGLFPVELSEEDKTVADFMFNAWSNFAIHGNPNSQGSPTWPQFDSGSGQYMVFDVESHVEVNFQHDRVNFWKNTLPQLANASIRGPAFQNDAAEKRDEL